MIDKQKTKKKTRSFGYYVTLKVNNILRIF